MKPSKEEALRMYEKHKNKQIVFKKLDAPRSLIREWLKEASDKHKRSVPMSEGAIEKLTEATAEETIADLRRLAEANPERVISRNYYRVNGKYYESTWSQYWGTFHEFKRQAGLVLTRQQHKLEKDIAKHASVDHYRRVNKERRDYGSKYDKPDNGERFKQVIIAGDLHDMNVDPFYLEVLIDTCERLQPDVIVFNGDIFDLPEFSRFTVDPRQWDVVGRIRFVHEEIFAPIRKACPNTQIDLIEGNHEFRLLKHMADATPALRAVLSDLHGMTVGTLLGLDKYQINYISKGNLEAYALTDIHKEVKKNYKIYYDSFICHHDTSGANLGFPGVNGHHHKTVVTPHYNEHFASYSWVQAGCGHKLDAEYCHPKWQLGFVITNVDTEARRTNFDVVTFCENFVFVGGKFYERRP